MAIPKNLGGVKEARYKENNIIIRDSVLHTILPPQLNHLLLHACWKSFFLIFLMLLFQFINWNKIFWIINWSDTFSFINLVIWLFFITTIFVLILLSFCIICIIYTTNIFLTFIIVQKFNRFGILFFCILFWCRS